VTSPNSKFFNRDLGWLEFSRRVMYQALNSQFPLLERVRFLSIFATNLDEFFMKRVGLLQRLEQNKVDTYGPDGLQVKDVLSLVRKQVTEMTQTLESFFQSEIKPQLNHQGIFMVDWKDLTADEIDYLRHYFHTQVFPVLTPLALDPAHPFPFISNLSISLGIKLHQPEKDENLFARLKIPQILPNWIVIPFSPTLGIRMVRLQDLISNHLGTLFPEMVIETVMHFRVTRSASIEKLEEDDAEEIMELVEEELRQRRTAQVVRVEFNVSDDPWIISTLQSELEIPDDYFYKQTESFNFQGLRELADLPRQELKFKPWVAITPAPLNDDSCDIFRSIRENDILLHHPYHNFSTTVERFVTAAVEDPQVYAIKMTLYRTGEKSPFVPLLIQAAEEGKQVVCVIELKARFDEAQNIFWGEMLEKAGVHVVYGLVGLKTHGKSTLVVRKESEGLRFYAHIGSGNYNPSTAKSYTDLGLLTANPEITSELIELFNYLTGLSLKRNYKTFLVAPINMRERFNDLIRRETENARNGLPAQIIAKMNNLEDQRLCDLLYEASIAGVKIDLIVRGFCCLVPGVPHQSENIRVTSVIGRFLEHSRLFYFRNGCSDPTQGDFFLGSADWMYRNLNSRVEIIVPILNIWHKTYCHQILQTMLMDCKSGWQMRSDGTYLFPSEYQNPEALGTHEYLMNISRQDKPGIIVPE